MYEVEYVDGHKASLSVNVIATNLFSQINEEGNQHAIFDSIIDHRTDGTEVLLKDSIIISKNGGRRKRETTKGWEILIQWKDGSTTWEKLKDIKECYPSEMADYAVDKSIHNAPAFIWWVPHVFNKRNRIVSKVKAKYWMRIHKFGTRIPKDVAEARQIYKDNGNHLWWNAILEEMKNVMVAFEEFDGTEEDIP